MEQSKIVKGQAVVVTNGSNVGLKGTITKVTGLGTSSKRCTVDIKGVGKRVIPCGWLIAGRNSHR